MQLYSQGQFIHPELHNDLIEEAFSCSLQAAAKQFRKLRDPKVAKLKGGYSSDAILVFLLWLKDIWMYVLEHHLSQQEAIQLVKGYTPKHAWLDVEYYLGMTLESGQSFQGLIDHLSLAFQSCETVSSLIGDFYNWSQKVRETEDMFAEKLQILVRKTVAFKPESLGEANEALKHQFAHNLRDSFFKVVARGQFLDSTDSESFIQFRGYLAMMFGSSGRIAKAVYTAYAAMNSEEISGNTLQDWHLSHNSQKHQNKINAQATKTVLVTLELDKALQENEKLKNLFNPNQLVEAMTKVVSTMMVKEHPKTSQDTKCKGVSSYVSRQWQPQLACGADGCWSPTSPATPVPVYHSTSLMT